jgi:signal transduction histidine kinase
MTAAPPDTDRATRWRASPALLFWTCIGLLFSLPVLGHGDDWRTPVLVSLTQWWAWGLLVPLMIALDDRLPFGRRQPWRLAGTQLVLSVLFSVLHVYLRAFLAALLGAKSWSRLTDLSELDGATSEGILWAMLVYCFILGAWWAHRSHQLHMAAELRVERMQRSYTEARLNALRLQLDPHFLFNTLNTISAQVQDAPELAREMIEQLGDLLRLSLERRDEVALSDELDFLDLYLSIQKIRFGDKLRVCFDIAPQVLRAAVPSLFIQPLVENAIRHGISRRAAGGQVIISAREHGGTLELTVRDDGTGLPPAWDAGAGLGLRLTRERLAGFHPDGATSLAIDNVSGGGVQVTLRLPLRTMEARHEVC